MTTESVTAALQEYEMVATEFGVPAVRNLRPGLLDEAIADVEARHRVTLSQDVKAVWSWHDGTEPLTPGYIPELLGFSWRFFSLEDALRFGNQARTTFQEGDADQYPRGTWVSLSEENEPDIIETTSATAPDSYVYKACFSEGSIFHYPVVSVAEKIRWYTWALRNGAWFLNEDGSWNTDDSRYPTDGMRHVI